MTQGTETKAPRLRSCRAGRDTYLTGMSSQEGTAYHPRPVRQDLGRPGSRQIRPELGGRKFTAYPQAGPKFSPLISYRRICHAPGGRNTSPTPVPKFPFPGSLPCGSETPAESLHDWPAFQLRNVLSPPSLAAPTARDSRQPLSCFVILKTGKAVYLMTTQIYNNLTLQIFDMYGRTDIRADASNKVAQVVKDNGQWILHLHFTDNTDLSGLHEARPFDNKQLTVAAGMAWVASGR